MDVFLLPAVILNINKWVYFRLRVRRQVKVDESIDFVVTEAKKLEKSRYQLNLATIVLIVVYIAVYFSLFLFGCAGNFAGADDW